MRTAFRLCLAVFLVFGFASVAGAVPKNDILLPQTGYFDFDSTKTIQDALNSYSFFTHVDWIEYRDKKDNDQKVVEAKGYFDLNKIKYRVNDATCTKGDAGYTGLTDTKPYMSLKFRPDFLKQTFTLLSLTIQGLSGGAVVDDPNLVWAMSLFTNELPDSSIFCAASKGGDDKKDEKKDEKKEEKKK